MAINEKGAIYAFRYATTEPLGLTDHSESDFTIVRCGAAPVWLVFITSLRALRLQKISIRYASQINDNAENEALCPGKTQGMVPCRGLISSTA